MKLKKIFLLLGLSVGGFLSCTSESEMEESLVGSQELSILLTSGDVSTKAVEVPSPDEEKINNCHVAIFDESGSLIYAKDFASMSDPATKEGHSVYTLQLGDVRTFGKDKKNVSVYILANAGDYTQFSSLGSYDKYKDCMVETSSFQADNLVKVGLTQATLEYPTAKEITVILTQLSARVDFLGVEGLTESTGNGEWVTTSDPYKSQWQNLNFGKELILRAQGDGCATWVNSGDVGYYNKASRATKRAILIKQTRTRDLSSGYQLLSKKMWGINEKSAVTIYRNDLVENQYQQLTPEDRAESFESSFYTYENCAIELLLDVQFSKAFGTETQERYGYLYQTRKSSSSSWPSISANNVNENDWTAWETTSTTSGKAETKNYTLTLPSLVKGNIYQIKGKIYPDVNSDIDWVIERKTINVGEIEFGTVK